MPPSVASCLFTIVIAGLFVLNRDREARTSAALWIPVFWLLISGSRPLSVWLGVGPSGSSEQYLEGSPFDRLVYLVLLTAGVLVLVARKKIVLRYLRANWVFVLFLLYCAASIIWSDYPDVAFKRWIKALGDYAMVLIILTDLNQLTAIKRVVARVGFLLVPISVLLIKYYPNLGRGYAPHWEGTAYYVGVAADKNMLGMTCMIFGLGSFWCFMQELQNPEQTRRARRLIPHGVVLAMVLWLFHMANSMTSLSCFLMATTLIAATTFRPLARRAVFVHFLVAAMLLVSISALFLDLGSGLVEKLGRDATLTGRTELWKQVLRLTPNPIVGTGFESFWLGTRLEKLWKIYWWHPNEAHNGYLEVYLNLGWVGVVLLAIVLATGYRSVNRLLKHNPVVGRLCLAYFFVGITYNLTEAAIRTTGLVWIALILAISLVPLGASSRKQQWCENGTLPSTSDSPIAVVTTTSHPVPVGWARNLSS